MKAKSIKGNSTWEIKTALEQNIADGYKPTLAFVFISVKLDRDAVSAILDAEGIYIFGATTGGEFIDGEIGAGSIAILLLDMNPAFFKIFLEEKNGQDAQTIAKEISETVLHLFSNPAFMVSFSMILTGDGEVIIKGIEDAAGKDCIIWGGAAGDDLMFKETFVFTNGKSSNKGIIILAIDTNKIEVAGRAASGWKSVGTEKTITKSEGVWLHTLDDKPALDVVMKYMGIQLTRRETIDFLPNIATFGLLRDNGEPVMRSAAYFNWDDKSIMVNGNFQPGTKIRFTLPPDFDIIEQVNKEAEEVKATEFPEADALVMFSCLGRLTELGPLIGSEIDGIRNTFDVPMAGFFTYGEFGRATNGNNEFHNMTCCWVALKERPHLPKEREKQKIEAKNVIRKF